MGEKDFNLIGSVFELKFFRLDTFPLQFREHLPRRRTASCSAPADVLGTQKSVRSSVSLCISIIMKFWRV